MSRFEGRDSKRTRDCFGSSTTRTPSPITPGHGTSIHPPSTATASTHDGNARSSIERGCHNTSNHAATGHGGRRHWVQRTKLLPHTALALMARQFLLRRKRATVRATILLDGELGAELTECPNLLFTLTLTFALCFAVQLARSLAFFVTGTRTRSCTLST